jgi:hypothetical protein
MNEIDVVVDVRQSPDTSELIVLKQKVAFGDASLIGAPVETRVGLMLHKAQLEVFQFAEWGPGCCLAVTVKNVGTVPFEVERVAFEHRYDQPQDFPLRSGIVAQELGGGMDLLPKDREKKGPLQPGEARDYFLPAGMFDGVALLGTSLRPDQYWIAAYSGRDEVGRVGGEHVWPFLHRSGIVVHRRAAPRFGTLPDADRLAVIRAVAPLRGAQPDQWPAAGAKPLEWAPSNFVVRAGEDLSVVVTQAPGKGVEIVDIVRPSALEQFDGEDKGPKQ